MAEGEPQGPPTVSSFCFLKCFVVGWTWQTNKLFLLLWLCWTYRIVGNGNEAAGGCWGSESVPLGRPTYVDLVLVPMTDRPSPTTQNEINGFLLVCLFVF